MAILKRELLNFLILYYEPHPCKHCRLQSERRRGKSTFTVLLASYLHYTLRHDVLVVDCDYQRDMRAVAQTPVG